LQVAVVVVDMVVMTALVVEALAALYIQVQFH
jgi:hypothetical protein